MRFRFRNYPYKEPKYMYMRTTYPFFKKDEVLRMTGSKYEWLVIEESYKEPLWKPLLRFFWFKIIDNTGAMKLKRLREIPIKLIHTTP